MRTHGLRMPTCVGLVLLLLNCPVFGIDSSLGRVIPRSGTSFVNATELTVATTIFSGNTITTQPEATAVVLLTGGDRILLGSSSHVTLKEYDNGLGLTLDSGFARVHSSSLAVLANGVVVRAAGNQGIFEVGIVDEDALLVFAISGDVEVQATNNTIVVPMDQAMRFEMKDIVGPVTDPAGANSITPKRMAIVWVFITVAGVGVAYLLLRSNINQLKDTCRQLISQISPSQPLPSECN